jgi:two-component SAPR family response regulator/tetratricopeptide (TPR) repeat protein
MPNELKEKLLACSDEPARLAELITYSKSLYYQNPKEACDFADEILSRAEKINHEEGICQGLSILGVGSILLGNTANGIKALSDLVQFAESRRNERHLANAYKYLGNAYRIIGNYAEAIVNYEKAIEIAKANHFDGVRAGALLGIGNMLSTEFLKHAESRPYFFEALKVYRALNDVEQEANALNSLGGTYSAIGDDTIALEYFEQALEKARATGKAFFQVPTLVSIGDVLRRLGDLDLAERYMTEALSLSDFSPHYQVDVKNFLARTYLDAKKFSQAKETLIACYAQAKSQKFLDAQKESCISFVRLYRAINDENATRRYEAEASALAEQQFGEKVIERLKNKLIELEVKRLSGEKPMTFQEAFRKATEKKYEDFAAPSLATQKSKAIVIQTFGKFSVMSNGVEVLFPRKKAREVFKYLLVNYKQSVTTDDFIEHLWRDTDYAAAKHALKNAILQVRNALEPNRKSAQSVIQFQDESYRLEFGDNVQIDCVMFKSLMKSARAAETTFDKINQLKEALSLYSGDFLKEDAFVEWTAFERESLKDLAISANAELSELMLQHGDKPSAIEYAKRLLALDTLCEKGYEILFMLYRQSADISAIKTLYQTCKTAYKKELGIAPPKRFEQFLKI